jgi:hypothetical protein
MAFTTKSQKDNVQAALEGIQIFYKKHPHVYQEISYLLYPDHQTQQRHSTESGVLIIGPEAKYSRIASIESLVTEEYVVGIDHGERTLMIGNYISGLSVDPLEQLQVYLQQLNSAQVSEFSTTSNRILLEMDQGEVKQTEIIYRKDDFQLEKIVLKYRRKIQLEEGDEADWLSPRMEILYSNTNLKGKGKALLRLDHYVSRSGSKWQPAGQYAAYQLINNIHENPFKQ